MYNLSSSNEGPTYFNVTLEVNKANLAINGLEVLSPIINGDEAPNLRERRLESTDPYRFKWYVKKTKTINEIEIAVKFDHPQIISKYKKDKIIVRILRKSEFSALEDTRVKIASINVEFEMPR